MIDFHAHILPQVDHGCKNLKEAETQLRLAKEAGVDTVIATSHFYPHRETPEKFLRRRAAAYRQLSEELKTADLPKVRAAAEVLVCRGMERIPQLEDLCIHGTRVLLLEMPFGAWNRELTDTVIKIKERRGLKVVLAHVNRYEEEGVQNLFDNGITGQINAEAAGKLFLKKWFRRWIEEGNIVALGSDIHGTEMGYKEFLKVQKYHRDNFEQLMRRAEAVLENNQIEKPLHS